MGKKRIYTIGEIRRKIISTQMVKARTKISVKIVKEAVSWDIKIENLELPLNLFFHTLNFSLALPENTYLQVKILTRNKEHHFINQGEIHNKHGGKVTFYSDHKSVMVLLKLITESTGLTYDIHKLVVESSFDFHSNIISNQYHHLLENLPTTISALEEPITDLTTFLQNDIFNYFFPIKYQISDSFIQDLSLLNKNKQWYMSNFGPGLISMFMTSTNIGPMILYNLLFFITNRPLEHQNLDTTDIDVERRSLEIESRITKNSEVIEDLVEEYGISLKKRGEIHQNLVKIGESWEKFLTMYRSNLDSWTQLQNQQHELSQKSNALDQTEHESTQLESLKIHLLKELRNYSQVKDICEYLLGDTSREQNSLQQFYQMISGMFTRLGKDVLLIDDKIKEYEQVIDFFKTEYHDSDKYQEDKDIKELAQQNSKRISILQNRYNESQQQDQMLRFSQYKILTQIVSLKIENSILTHFFNKKTLF